MVEHVEGRLVGPYAPLVVDVPPRELHPNARVSWQPKARAKARHRKATGEIAWAYVQTTLHGKAPEWKEATVALHYFFGKPSKYARPKLHDPDNLIAWAKTTIDALADAKIIADDRELVYLPPRQAILETPRSRLELLLWQGKLPFPPING